MKYSPNILFLIAFVSLSFGSKLHANPIRTEKNWAQCRVKKASNTTEVTPNPITKNPTTDALYLQADTGTIQKKGISSLKGNVIIQHNDTQFNADDAQYNQPKNLITANGNIVFSTANTHFQSHSIQYNLSDNTGLIKKARYRIGLDAARGKSTSIALKNKNIMTLEQATFTTCPTAAEDSWYFEASNITINNKTNIGKAKNITLKVADVPVFYFPWLNFPLNNRRLSGFLTPSIRLESNAGISIPYYFNLAPNYDATITASTYKNHGVKLDTEFRYLTANHQGRIEYDFIPEDKTFSSAGKQYRDYFNIKHYTNISDKTAFTLTAEGVSDNQYFDDLATSLQVSSRSALQRRLEITHKEAPWTSSLAVEDYQILDVNNAPYAKLPEINVHYAPKVPPQAFKIGMDAELVYFDKDNAVTGTRANLKLSASKKWGNDAWFFKPSFSFQQTNYALNHSSVNNISRSLPTATLEAGLFFDRTLKRYTQTLEPRLFYTYTPYKDQSNIPIFDTAQTNFSTTNQLFSDNRFTGKDRVADSNQLTFALTSRLQDRANGKELFKASIGQIFSFDDKKVTLPGGTISTARQSDLVLELSGRLNENFRLSSTTVWNQDKNKASSQELRLNYQDDKKRLANFSYHQLDTELKEIKFSGSTPLNRHWSAVASINQDIKNSRNLESLLGLEYQDCCWKTRIVAKRYLTSDNINYETPIFIEFELKGLGSVGTGASRELKDKIYGYDDY